MTGRQILLWAELTIRKTDGPSPRPVHCPACNVITSILAGGGSRVHHSCLLGSGLSHVGQVWKHFGQDSCDQGPSSPSFQRLLLRTADWGKAWREWGSLAATGALACLPPAFCSKTRASSNCAHAMPSYLQIRIFND